MSDLPVLNAARLPSAGGPFKGSANAAPARFLLLHGSARARSFSRLLCEEAAHLLRHLGGEARIFDPVSLPLPDTAPSDHPKVQEFRELLLWSEAQLWCSPENYGTVSGVMKVQLESTPPVLGGVPVFQAKPLAVAQICGAGQSFNTLTTLAAVGRWIGMLVTSTQLCVPKVQEEFDAEGRMKPSSHYDRLVDLVEELYKVTTLLRGHRPLLLDRYSARIQAG